MQYKKFITSEFSNEQEEKYLNKVFDNHFDQKYRERYSSILEEKYAVRRDQGNVTLSPNKGIKYLKVLMSVAAVFLVAVLSLPFLGNDDLNSTSSSFIKNDFFVNKNLKRGENVSDLLRSKAILAYNEKDFKQAITSYAQIGNPTSEDVFFIALSHLYSEQFEEAGQYFKQIESTNSFKFKEEKKWFHALALLKLNKNVEAKELLKSITVWRTDEANKLLKALK